jgi:hypothetical protein
MTKEAAPADRKPRRKLTVTDHLAAFDERIARLAADLEQAKANRAAYISAVQARARDLTAELPKE